MGLSDKINSIMGDLGKFTFEHWTTYLIVVLAIASGGILSAIFAWHFAVFVPLFALLVGFVARNRHKKQMG